MDYLTSFDKQCHEYCVKKGQLNSKSVHDTGMHGECRFMKGEGRAAVALASLPGSGNTWVRGLLEKATGICTGECLIIIMTVGMGFIMNLPMQLCITQVYSSQQSSGARLLRWPACIVNLHLVIVNACTHLL